MAHMRLHVLSHPKNAATQRLRDYIASLLPLVAFHLYPGGVGLDYTDAMVHMIRGIKDACVERSLKPIGIGLGHRKNLIKRLECRHQSFIMPSWRHHL